MLAMASACPDDDPSAARTVSEFGTAPMVDGARSSWTVPATLAAPIGTTDNVWSSRLAVTAYSPASGNKARNPPGCCTADGVVTGAGAATGTLVGSAVGSVVGDGCTVGWAAAVGPVPGPFVAPLHAAPRVRIRPDRMATR